MDMFSHQKEMFLKLETIPYVINGSEAGTGKTLPAIRLIEKLQGKSIVVCPSFLCYNWLSEFMRFSVANVKIFHKSSNKELSEAKCIISTYPRLEALYTFLKNSQIQVSCIVADESHYLNNTKAIRTKLFHSIIHNIGPSHLKLLTGTPMRNRIQELYSQLALLDIKYQNGFLDRYRSQWEFNNRFCIPQQIRIWGGRTITKFSGYRNLDELAIWLKPYYFRYTLEDVQDLPELSRYCVTISSDSQKLDKELEKYFMKEKSSPYISTVKEANAIIKAPKTTEYVANLLSSEPQSVVIFSDHVESSKYIHSKLSKSSSCGLITGKTPMDERRDIVRDFQGGKLQVIIGTIGAMGTGITLTRASIAVFNDRSWVPSDNIQSEKRIHRMSQEKKCKVIDIVRDGIDKKILIDLEEKARIINKVL